MFNKPKRNIRRRPFNEDDEDNENRMDSNDDSQSSKFKAKKKEKPKQTLLSFGEELDEGAYSCQKLFVIHSLLFDDDDDFILFISSADEGEVFKVKKSSRSKKLMKQLDHERKKKKGEEKMQVDTEQAEISVKQENDLEIKTDDLVVSYLYDVLLLLIFSMIIYTHLSFVNPISPV